MRRAALCIALAACGYAKPALTGGGDDGSGSDGDGGPRICTPGTATCNGEISHACNAQGTGYDDTDCDPMQGLACDAAAGTCEGACAASIAEKTSVGCEFYPTVTGNAVNSIFNFAVVMTNAGGAPAHVTIEDGALTSPISVTVAPMTSLVQTLPWQYDLKLCPEGDASTDGCVPRNAVLAPKGAFHLRSDAPISVAQFSPLEISIGGAQSSTTDASLLFPVTAWGRDYVMTSALPFSGGGIMAGAELAVVAAQPGSHVTITTTAATAADTGVPAFAAGTPQVLQLTTGDALEITSLTGDLSGSRVTSDKPVQVIGAHACAFIPTTATLACDHLEESMPPIAALGTDYIVVSPQDASHATGKEELVRIVATADNTHLTFVPDQAGATKTIPKAGGFVDIDSAASFEVKADIKVLVAQYMVGGGQSASADGDPAMTVAIPVAGYARAYTFGNPTSFAEHYLDVVAPSGTHLVLDGTAKTVSTIPGTSFGVFRMAFPSGDSGLHAITGDAPFGAQVYGVDPAYDAFWYPAGFSLTP